MFRSVAAVSTEVAMGFRYTLRPATPEDCGDILRLMKDHAKLQVEREGANSEVVKLTELQLKEDCFGDGAYCHLLIVDASEDNDTSDTNVVPQIAAFAIYYFAYSSWVGKVAYLEELYVESMHRGKGLGKLIISRVAQIGVERGCKGLQWVVGNDNKNAQQFYTHLGAIASDWIFMSARGDNFLKIASLDEAKHKPNIQVL